MLLSHIASYFHGKLLSQFYQYLAELDIFTDEKFTTIARAL